MNLACIILAAGKGTRMKSEKAKVLHEICFKPLLHYSVKLATDLKSKKVIAVVGHQEATVRDKFGDSDVIFSTQEQQLGTGHAVQCAIDKLDDEADILIVNGDSPLFRHETISEFYKEYKAADASVAILTANAPDPTNYGRVVKDGAGNFLRIVEEKDADKETKKISEVSSGTYLVKKNFLIDALKNISNSNAQNEYYLTDILSIAVNEGRAVVAHVMKDFDEGMGVNSRLDQANAERVMRCRINEKYMLDGVTMLNPESTYIEDGVEISNDVTIHPGVTIRGKSVINEGATIHNGVIISDSEIGVGSVVLPYSVIEKSQIEDKVSVGPFARLRPGAVIKSGAKIGNFVEVKNSTIGEGSKAGHLTYLGDATIGADVNIGAGTITCNYDGSQKFKTIIEDCSFIGSNSSLVAPVTIKEGALVGAGAVITKDVPAGTIAVERSSQRHYKRDKEGN
ncbi:bifunctional UDP-N-acetylglucosamine diphosphorylase/glucosamine-1-phosphate N-acetyltransferase GlmU [Thermodesulfobacteriota bacterium]